MGTPIAWTDLEIAFERNGPDVESFIRLATGEIVTLIAGAEDEEALRREVRDAPGAFLRVDPVPSREQYRWMERFVASVSEPDLRQRLQISIDGKGAFRRFKDVLLGYPVERERWFAYRGDWLHWHINQWIATRPVVVAEPPPWGWSVEPPALPEPLPRPPAPSGENLRDALRRRAHDALELLPAGELPAALSFLEFLRDRGSAELSGSRLRMDVAARRAAHRARQSEEHDEHEAREPAGVDADDEDQRASRL